MDASGYWKFYITFELDINDSCKELCYKYRYDIKDALFHKYPKNNNLIKLSMTDNENILIDNNEPIKRLAILLNYTINRNVKPSDKLYNKDNCDSMVDIAVRSNLYNFLKCWFPSTYDISNMKEESTSNNINTIRNHYTILDNNNFVEEYDKFISALKITYQDLNRRAMQIYYEYIYNFLIKNTVMKYQLKNIDYIDVYYNTVYNNYIKDKYSRFFKDKTIISNIPNDPDNFYKWIANNIVYFFYITAGNSYDTKIAFDRYLNSFTNVSKLKYTLVNCFCFEMHNTAVRYKSLLFNNLPDRSRLKYSFTRCNDDFNSLYLWRASISDYNNDLLKDVGIYIKYDGFKSINDLIVEFKYYYSNFIDTTKMFNNIEKFARVTSNSMKIYNDDEFIVSEFKL